MQGRSHVRAEEVESAILGAPTRDSEWWRRYNEYLKSPDWAWKRWYKLEQQRYTCERCGYYTRLSPIHVHHKTYERVGHERPEDLQVLCENCHQSLHPTMRGRARISKVRMDAERADWAEMWQQDWGPVDPEDES